MIKDWQSRWFAGRSGEYRAQVLEDLNIRDVIKKQYPDAGISRVEIERSAQDLTVNVHTARPGIVIGKKGEDIERLRRQVLVMNNQVPVQIAVEEIRKPELDARLVAENVCQQLEKRIMFRRAMRRAVQSAMRLGAKGVKVMIAGRLNGAEIARTEWYREGRVPLHTLRADVDYGFAEAHTTYGVIGVKVWVFKGEVMPGEAENEVAATAQPGVSI